MFQYDHNKMSATGGYKRGELQCWMAGSRSLRLEDILMMSKMESCIEQLLCAMRLAGWEDDSIAKNARETLDQYHQHILTTRETKS